MESNALRYFRVTFWIWAGLDCLFLIQEVIFIANIKAFTPKSVMNKPQTEGRVNHVCTEEHRRRSTLFSNNKITQRSCEPYYYGWTDHQRSAANTSVNKMRLDIFVFNIFNYCSFASHSEFAFHCFNSFEWILNLFCLGFFVSEMN